MKTFFTLSLHLLITSFLFAQSLPAYLPADGLVAWYPFNGNANDESGNGHHGFHYRFNGSGYYPTVNMSGFFSNDRFNNQNSSLLTNEYAANVSIPISNDFFQSDFTISIWSKNDSIVAQYPTIVESDNFQLGIGYGNIGGPISIGSTLGSSGGGVISIGPVFDWTHIVIVNENFINKLYINTNTINQQNYNNTHNNNNNNDNTNNTKHTNTKNNKHNNNINLLLSIVFILILLLIIILLLIKQKI